MNLISRTFSGLLVFSAMLMASVSLSAEWLVELGVVTDGFGERISLREIERENEKLRSWAHASVKRLCLKESIAEALRDGQMTLIDAAACFRVLHKDPKSWHDPYHHHPQPKDGEGWCREVMEWTEMYLGSRQHSTAQIEALHQRLEAEMQEWVKCHGKLTLPE